MHVYAFARSFVMIARCIVRSVAKRCAKLSHACFRPGKVPRYQWRHRLNYSNFYCTNDVQLQMACTHVNYYDWLCTKKCWIQHASLVNINCIDFITLNLAININVTYMHAHLHIKRHKFRGTRPSKGWRRLTVLNLNEVPVTFNNMKDENRCFLQSCAYAYAYPQPFQPRRVSRLRINGWRCVARNSNLRIRLSFFSTKINNFFLRGDTYRP